MPTKYQEIVLPALEGLNQDENPDILADGELSIALNVWRKGATIGTRPGTEREPAGSDYATAITGGKEVQGGYEYRWASDTNRKLVFVSNGNVWTSSTTSLDKTTNSVQISNTAGLRWNFTEFKDQLYGAGGSIANGDNCWFWDGANPLQKITVVNNASAAVTPQYVTSRWNYGFLGGFQGTDPSANPEIIRYSVLGDMTQWPIGNTFGGASAIGGFSSYGDEFVTGFGAYKSFTGDWLLILTNRRLYPVLLTGDSVTPFYQQGSIANGCISQAAFLDLGLDSGEAIYVSEQGIHSLRQSQQHGSEDNSFLSWKIRPVFQSINRSRMGQICGAYWKTFGIALFAVPTGSSTVNDTLLCLDMRGLGTDPFGIPHLNSNTARWYIWQLNGFDFTTMLSSHDSAFVPYIYGGSTVGDIARFNPTVFSDLGNPYSVHLRTKHHHLGAPGVRKSIGNVMIGIQPGGNYTPIYQPVFDYGLEGKPIPLKMPQTPPIYGKAIYGQSQYGGATTFRIKVYATGWGDTIAHDFVHNGLNQPFSIAHLSYQVAKMGGTTGSAL